METTTFKQLLTNENKFGIEGIIIPKIQRAFAQGRTDLKTTKTRERFLFSIYDKLIHNTPLTLDFIYGYVDKGSLIPLDGQQRLTTLWLLHWYAAKKNNVQTEILAKFSYNTRYSARDFIKRLSSYSPKWEGRLSETIRNEGWFPLDWANDSTVSGMFVMLDAIDNLFSKVDDLWQKLDFLNFYFLPLEELNLTDEIYIKMNSRGKPLTDFEHFKAEFLKEIRNIKSGENEETAEEVAKRIGNKIDLEWTDLLWQYRDKNSIIDEGYLRLFRIVCHILTYLEDRSFSDEISKLDDFQLIKEFFTGEKALHNIQYLEEFFDSWVEINNSIPQDVYNTGIEAFFNRFLSEDHQVGKAVPIGRELDLFRTGLKSYPNLRNPGVLQWMTTFYSFLIYIQNKEKVSEDDFRRRLRIVLNLQKNSANEIVDTPKGDAGNRMPAILHQVKEILLKGVVDRNVLIDGKERPTFNVAQLTEEGEKLEFTHDNPLYSEPLFTLEDHWLLNGRTLVVGFENTHLYQRFADMFDSCSGDAIDCALLSVGDYSQRLTKQIVQLGSGDNGNMGYEAWYNVFHPTERVKNFDATAEALRTVLNHFDSYDDDALYDFASEYVEECEENKYFDWRYYYLSYEIFRSYRYGKYTRYEDTPYEFVAIYAPKYESSNAYQCFLAALYDEWKIEDIRWLSYKDGWLVCLNDRYQYYNENRDKLLSELVIPQEEGIDKVDRILYFRENPL